MTAACEPDLEKWEANVRPGVALNAGPTILTLADWPEALKAETPRAAVEQIQADLRSFKETNQLDQVVVVNVTSTEPPFETGDVHYATPEKLTAALASKTPILPASAMYAWAAARPRLAVHQLHAVARGFVPGRRCSWPTARRGLRRQGRQDRRDAAEDGAGPDVRPCATGTS